MKTITKLIFAFVLIAALSFGQTALSSTTLGAAITTNNTGNQSITLSSTSTMLGLNTQNSPQTVLYVDKEFMWVVSVTDSTHVIVARAKGPGEAGRPTGHANGAIVLFANAINNGTGTTGTTYQVPAASAFKSEQRDGETYGSCTATNEMFLPRVYLPSGDILDCKRTGAAGTSGQWILVGSGTMGGAGRAISNFCTGTVGSGETEYIVGAACSGATTETARILVTTAATLANFYVAGSANVVSMGSDAVTVRVNGADTAVTCTIAAGAKTCNDTTHSVSVAVGDYVTFKLVTTASDTLANVGVSVGAY